MENVDLLIIGGSGFIGANLTQAAARSGLNVAYTYLNHELRLPGLPFRLDVRDARSLEDITVGIRPNAIIYCAKPPLVSSAREHQAVSVEGIRTLVKVIGPWRCKLVYISTNAVFNGKRGQYREHESPDADERGDPYRAYAMARAQGERLVLADWANSIIVRAADVNGRDVKGNLNSRLAHLIKQLKSGIELERLSRCYISPTLVDNLVIGLLEVSGTNFRCRGTLHLAGPDRMSYYDFARLVARQIGAREELVIPDNSREQDLSLDSTYTRRMLHTPFLEVRDQLKIIFDTAVQRRTAAGPALP